MSYVIRKYTDADLSGVLSSWENASKLAHPFLSEEFLEGERYNIPNVYLPNTETWVSEVDGVVAGFIALMGNEVGAIFLDPRHHGQGIGRALMDTAREIHESLEVEVFAENTIGREFYDRYGFELMEESVHPQTGQAVHRMRFIRDS